MDYKSMAAEILKNVGGEKNVSHFEHCSTRLRFSLADPAKANLEALKKINGVMGVVMKGQCQVIIGNNVIEVYEEIMKLGTFSGRASLATLASMACLCSFTRPLSNRYSGITSTLSESRYPRYWKLTA